MNEGQFLQIRSYLEGISNIVAQQLAEQKRTNELLERMNASAAAQEASAPKRTTRAKASK